MKYLVVRPFNFMLHLSLSPCTHNKCFRLEGEDQKDGLALEKKQKNGVNVGNDNPFARHIAAAGGGGALCVMAAPLTADLDTDLGTSAVSWHSP